MNRTLLIGDIHGCYDELVELVASANLTADDRVVAVGDLVDRGPKSLDVVRYFAADPAHRISVLGNHEEKHLLGARASDRSDPSGRIVRAEVSDTDYQEMLVYFRRMPLWLDLPEALVVHAGLEPGRPLESQDPKAITGRGSQGRRGWDGRSTPWFDDPRFEWPKPVVFGHLAAQEVTRGERRNVWGIDTGASVGGRLTGLLLPDFVTMSVPTPDYYDSAYRRWRDRFLVEDLPELRWQEIEALDLSATGPEARAAVRSVLARLGEAVERVEREISALQIRTNWVALPPQEKGRVSRELRFGSGDGRATRWRALALEGLSSGASREIIRRRLTTPAAVEAALSEGE